MKITFFALNSSFTHTNLAIRYLASALEKDGYLPIIKEYTLKDKKARVLYELINTESKFYAFSVYIWNRNEMLSYARELKKLRPDCRIIFGGPEVSFENEDFFKKYPYVDMLIRGEGESVITDICKQNEIHTVIDGKCNDAFIDMGILYDRYPAKGDILYYESVRGCPYRCSYCLSSLSEGIRAKSVDKILGELKEFEKLENKPRIIKFIDRTFNYDINRAKLIWKALGTGEYSLNYHFEIAADLLDEESFEILSKIPNGKIQIEAGIQTTNRKALQAINRKTDSTKVIENLTRLKAYGNIHIHADLIAGLPYEDIGSFAKSFDDTIACCHKLQLGFLKMLKGSYIRERATEHGYIYESDPPYKVLSNKYISYNEIYKLEKIASTLERFYTGTGFRHTMEYLLSKLPSPFDFFEKLTLLQEKELDKTSQHECRMLLIKLIEDDGIAMGKLALDTLISENKNPPEQLKKYYTEQPKEIINSIQNSLNSCNRNLYVYTFSFDKDNYYIIDRTKHIFSTFFDSPTKTGASI